MSAITNEVLRNIELHLEVNRKAYYGTFKGDVLGAFCYLPTKTRAYFIQYIIDENIGRFFLDVYPQIVCEKPYYYMLSAYVNEKTSGYKSGRIDIDETNGEVKVRMESPIVGSAVTREDIKDMETIAISICDHIEKRLDKLAHGVYFKENDEDVMGEREKWLEEMMSDISEDDLSSLWKKLKESGDLLNDQYDEDDEDGNNNNGCKNSSDSYEEYLAGVLEKAKKDVLNELEEASKSEDKDKSKKETENNGAEPKSDKPKEDKPNDDKPKEDKPNDKPKEDKSFEDLLPNDDGGDDLF